MPSTRPPQTFWTWTSPLWVNYMSVVYVCYRYTYEQIQTIAANILTFTKHQPKVGIICGSGLGGLADQVENADVINYSQITDFPVSTGTRCFSQCVCMCTLVSIISYSQVPEFLLVEVLCFSSLSVYKPTCKQCHIHCKQWIAEV